MAGGGWCGRGREGGRLVNGLVSGGWAAGARILAVRLARVTISLMVAWEAVVSNVVPSDLVRRRCQVMERLEDMVRLRIVAGRRSPRWGTRNG